MSTSQQDADELLAEHQAQRRMDLAIQSIADAIDQAEQEVAFYERRVLRLEGAVCELTKHFADPRMVKVWFDEIEVCRDVLSRMLDKAEGKWP